MRSVVAHMIPSLRFSRRNLLIAGHDVIATACAVLASFYLRFGDEEISQRLPLLLAMLPTFLIISAVICYLFELTTTKWRFISYVDLLNILKVATLLSIVLLIADYIFIAPNLYGTFFFGKTTIIFYWFLQVAFLSFFRVLYRYYRLSRTRHHTRATAAPSLIIGSSADADILIRGVESGAILNVMPVGILSPSSADQGQLVRGVSVVGHVDELAAIVLESSNRKRVERLVLTPSAFAPACRPEFVISEARRLGLRVNRLSFQEDESGLRLAPVAVEDLLLRPAVKIEYSRLEDLIRGKSVAVTGGGGSIGSEICDRLVAFGAERLMILEHSEPALYAVLENLAARKSAAHIEGHIADIRDRGRISEVLKQFRPDFVFHAAALKHVPILEKDLGEGIKTNVFGTINVADAALAAGARAMVMISTDKAVSPVSMLGLTKRFAEMYCQALDHDLSLGERDETGIRFISVRFGNVLASNGSVVPKFKAQIEAGGPVTVTHPDMVRYFMTIREACDLVITAARHAFSETASIVSVYVLNMGQPVRIKDLADRMIRLSGLTPDEDIKIEYTGIRPGERLYEIMFADEEPPTDIGVEGVLAAKANQPDMASLKGWIEEIAHALEEQDHTRVRQILKDAVPEFNAGSERKNPRPLPFVG